MSLLHHTPSLDEASAVVLTKTLFGLDVTCKLLNSERDQNFLVRTADKQGYVLKIANGLEDRAMLEAQNGAMAHLQAADVPVCPGVFPAIDGSLIGTTTVGEQTYFVRLVSYLEGAMMSDVGRHSAELLHNLGTTVGQIDHALGSYDHPALHYDFHWDLATAPQVIANHLANVTDESQRAFIDQTLAEYNAEVAPILPTLRQSVIHNDANDANVILGGGLGIRGDLYTRNQTVTGIIDFGDMIYTHTVNDLAITIAYAMLDKKDPLAIAATVTRGYHTANPLTDDEFKVLWNLVKIRLCVSICMAAYQIKLAPDNEYLLHSQQPIRNTLPKIEGVHLRLAEAVLRGACSVEISAHASRVNNWLVANQGSFAPVIGRDMREEPAITVDLSIGSPLINGNFALNDEPFLTPRIWAEMAAAGVQVSIGRYDEPRLIYTDDIFTTGDGLLDERRTVHLGFDLFAEAGTLVYAPLAGVVHTAKYNPGHLDYGGVILLEHQTDSGDVFYSLYGHLSKASAEALTEGQSIAKGEKIAEFGEPHENGGWPPHLHLQLMTDLLDMGADFPGVVLASQREVWKTFCPDPNLLVGAPADRFPQPDPEPQETLRVRREKIGRNLSLGYRNHLKIVRGWKTISL